MFYGVRDALEAKSYCLFSDFAWKFRQLPYHAPFPQRTVIGTMSVLMKEVSSSCILECGYFFFFNF